MLKGLKRKLVILSVLVAACAALSSAPPAHAGGVFCLDDGIGAYGCFGVVCCNEWGGCWCG